MQRTPVVIACNGHLSCARLAALDEKERETAQLHAEHREHVQRTAEKLNLMMYVRGGWMGRGRG
jgi:hypothetical protein